MFEKATQVRRFFKVSLWGGPKTGKTRGALSFPKPCVIDGERGTSLYAEKYNFSVKEVNHWKDMLDVLDWLEATDHGYLSLIVDPLTIFWQDLCDAQVDYVRNRRGSEILSTGDWGIIKRRWKSFLNRLMALDMNVILVMRQKDEYDSIIDARTGDEKSRRTGDHLPDAEKSTSYVFDFILHCYTVDNKKTQSCDHFVQIDGTRHDGLPKYKTFNVTQRMLYKDLFAPLEEAMSGNGKLEKKADPAPDPGPEGAVGSPSDPGVPTEAQKPHSHQGSIGDLLARFSGGGPDDVAASGESLKTLMTRAGQMRWFDDTKFSSKDGKALVTALFKVEKSNELKKSQVDFLYREFGEVLAGRSSLARDGEGVPYIQPHSNVNVAEAQTA